jgi:hypothetical protein
MAIPKMSSQQLLDVLNGSQEKISNMKTGIENIKRDIENKLIVMRHETGFVMEEFKRLEEGDMIQVPYTKIFAKDSNGYYDHFGAVVHQKFTKPPINIYNIKVAGTGEIYFRNDVKVSVNGVYKDVYQSMLKHDGVPSKEIYFEEYQSPQIAIEIEQDLQKQLGPTYFNTIEIDPFLPGSFNISKIRIYAKNEDGTLNETPYELGPINNTGKIRVKLPKRMEFTRVNIFASINYQVSNDDKLIYPFGIKHLYFYDAEFKSDSMVLATIEADNNIAIIDDAITVKTPLGNIETTITDRKIRLFLDLDKSTGTLSSEVYPGSEIARNSKILYTRVPIEDEVLYGIKFNITTKNV